MLRMLKVVFTVSLTIGLMAGVAMAGTTLVNNGAGTEYVVSNETLGAARDVTINGTETSASTTSRGLAYTLGQNLTSGNLLRVQMNGGLAFAAGAYRVCARDNGANTATSLAVGTPGANATSFNFQTDTTGWNTPEVTAGSTIWISTAADCNSATSADALVRVGTGAASVGHKTITIDLITSGGQTVDTASSANAVNVTREFTPALTTRTMTIDFLNAYNNGPGDGSRFTDGAASSNLLLTSGAANVLEIDATAVNYAAQNTAAVANAGLTVSAVVNLDSTNNWTGISSAYVANNNNCANGNNVSNIASSFTNGAALNVTAAGFNGAMDVANNVNLVPCFQVNGTTSLIRRTITGSYQIQVTGTGANPYAAATATFQTWDVNGYQAIVPILQKNASVPTYCAITNGSNRQANVFLDVLGTDAGAVTTRYDLGTLTAGLTKLYTFDANGVSSGGAVVNALSGIGSTGAARYASTITVTTAQNNVSMHCMQADPGGAKRLTPVLTGQGVGWKQ